jgi:2-polyprenyl-6-methoxyphenol hydroxylase-like FAD-dependent oxidoreductase
MRVAVVGAGVAGLAAAAALSRAGHQVRVFEQADGLRASGLAFHLWSNATSLLPALGIPASRIPGEPLDRMLVRAAGREIGVMDLAPAGLPHVTVERAELLTGLAAVLPPRSISYGARCTDVDRLASEHDLIVVADGAHSLLRQAVVPTPRGRRWRWTVWQACVTADFPELPVGAGVGVLRPGMFVGIFRLGGGRATWFVELPGRKPGNGEQLLHELGHDEDPVLRALASATPALGWTRWHAADIWPQGPLYRGNVVLVGDAAHAMLAPATQGACQAVEDAVVLADALTIEPTVSQALARYERKRLARVRRMVAMGRAGTLARPSNPLMRAIPSVLYARLVTSCGAPALRRHTRPVIHPPDTHQAAKANP